MHNSALYFKRIKSFFTEIEEIKEDYFQSKKKESNDFNIFKLLKMQNKEVETHNRLIGELLDPNGSHKMGLQFQQIFLELILPQKAEHIWQVEIEERFGACKFDISLRCENTRIVIESKIDSQEGFQQLKRYYDTLSQNQGINEFYILFLTKEGYTPRSIHGKLKSKVIPISYINDISNWISECITITKNRNLREILHQYHDLLIGMKNQELITDYMNRISNFCFKNNYVDLALDIADATKHIKIKIQNNFWAELEQYLKDNKLTILDDSKYLYNQDKIEKYYFNQKNNKHYGIPILMQQFETGEEAILFVQIYEELYFSVLIAKKGKYLSYDKYKSKISFEKKLNTFTHNWDSSYAPSWYEHFPSAIPKSLNFKTFEQKELRELSDPNKQKVLVKKLGDEICDLVQRFRRTRN
jgi:hypothetical protein